MTPLLAVRDLRTTFASEDRRVAAVDGVTFEVEPGRTLALVGESGCGKSVTALSIMGLVPPPGRIEPASSVRFEGTELVGLAPRALRDLRGNAMAMIFQEPMSSLNPAWTIGEQIVEGLRRHRGIGAVDAARRAVEALERVRISAPAERFHAYPHQLSGGMRQRAMIAMALACEPRLLIADEPTTALDVTVQAQILELLKTLQRETGMAMVLITHDLGVVAEVADDVAVMYAGRIVERAPVGVLFEAPQHPYTVGLLGSVPRLDVERTRLVAIDGQVPGLFATPRGCRFAPRCPFADAACRAEEPALRAVGADATPPGVAAARVAEAGAGADGGRATEAIHAAACRKAPLDPDRLARERLAVEATA